MVFEEHRIFNLLSRISLVLIFEKTPEVLHDDAYDTL